MLPCRIGWHNKKAVKTDIKYVHYSFCSQLGVVVHAYSPSIGKFRQEDYHECLANLDCLECGSFILKTKTRMYFHAIAFVWMLFVLGLKYADQKSLGYT